MKNKTARREIESLDYYLQNHTDDYSEESHTAMMMAIKALEREPCEDAISIEEAIHCLEQLVTDMPQLKLNAQKVADAMSDLPSVYPKQKTGHWIAEVDRWGDIVTTVNGYRCDKCNTFNSDKDNYCPNCGARMAESEGIDADSN